MRFILLLKSNPLAESGQPPTTAQIEAMMAFYSAMNEAGVVLGAEGLHSSAVGARVTFHAPSAAGATTPTQPAPTVVHGPFTPADALVAGYWVIQVRDLAEALDWVKQCPLQEEGATIEVRQIAEMDDDKFADRVTDELKAQADRMRKETEERVSGAK
jgi:hypothetical protein